MSCFERNNRVKTIQMNDLKQSTTEEKTIPQERDGKYHKLFKEFVENSSAGGIDKVFSSKPLLIRSIWFIICVICYGAMAYLSSMLIKQYLANPTSTFVDVSFQRDMSFPSVTICNLNKFRKSAVARNLPNVSKILVNYRKQDKKSWYDNDKEKLHLKNIYAQSGLKSDNINNDDVSAEEILNNMVLQASTEYSQEQLHKTGYGFKNLIAECRWMGVKCHEGYFSKYWTYIWNWKYGNCYVFNFGLDSNGSSIEPLITSKAGPSNGLTLGVFLAQNEYIPELNVEAGIKVVIVDQMQYPFPYHEGVTVAPGKSTSIALRKELIERVDSFKNYSCISDTLEKENIYNNKNNHSLKYTVQSCLDTCLLGYQQKRCNCTEPKYPVNGNKCSTNEQYNCISEVNYNYKGDDYGCLKSCPQRCRSVSYRTTLSNADISVQSQVVFRTALSSRKTFKNSFPNKGDFLKNFLQVKIYFEELNLVRIHEQFTYSVSNVLADIGGQLGLWVGLSVITFAELGDLLITLIMLTFSKTQE